MNRYLRNDGRFPDGAEVRVRYPLPNTPATAQSRGDWPWLPGHILGQCGPNEWHVVVDGVPELAEEEGGALSYPTCFRASVELLVDEDEGEEAR